MRGKFTFAALVAGTAFIGIGLAQAGNDIKMAVKGTWLHKFLGVEKKEEPELKKEEVKKPVDPGPSLQEVQAKAKTDLLRRQEICLRLREIAVQTGDEDLHRKADQLDQRAFEIYLQRTGSGMARNAAGQVQESFEELAEPFLRGRGDGPPAGASTTTSGRRASNPEKRP